MHRSLLDFCEPHDPLQLKFLIAKRKECAGTYATRFQNRASKLVQISSVDDFGHRGFNCHTS